MNTEITDKNGENPAGWIFFDGECRFCLAARRRLGPVFDRRGFTWLPLQTPGTAERLGLTPEQLMAEMWFWPAGGGPISGVSAWIGLMRHVWWLKPFAMILDLPIIKRLAQVVYRWTARHRYCIAGRCQMPSQKPRPRHKAFLELP